MDILNCTIVSNVLLGPPTYGTRGGAGINLGPPYGQPIAARICSSIIYSNTISMVTRDISFGVNPVDYCTEFTNLFFTNCCLSSTNIELASAYITNVIGSGNFTSNPAFKNWAGQDFRLKKNSPCVNAGFNQAWMTDAVDLDGRKRLRYGRVDVGAYEVIYDGSIYQFQFR